MKNPLTSLFTKTAFIVLSSLVLIQITNAQFSHPALFVVADAENLNPAEHNIDSVLDEMGFTVAAMSEADVTDGSASGVSLILISATVSSSTVTTNMPNLYTSAVPIINWEPFLYDFFGHTEGDGGEFNTTEIEIVMEEHQLAGELSNGVVTIAPSERAFSYGVPAGDADIIAVNTEVDTQAVIFCYEEGASMHEGTAPARRVGSFLLNDVADSMTVEGWELFKASVKWAMSYVDPAGIEEINAQNNFKEFILYDNYPNPFRQVTQIRYTIPQQTNVRIVICNALGKEVVTLVNQIKPAGMHSVKFHAGDMATGLYFYRLMTPSHTITKSMILIK